MNRDNRVLDLLTRAKDQASTGQGGITGEEIAWVVAELQADVDTQSKDALMRILGYATYGSYKHVLEQFLSGPNPELAQSAIWVLCTYWDLTEEYTEQLYNYIVGVPWDDYGKCQGTAIHIAEIYMTDSGRNKPALRLESRLLEALIKVCEESNLAKTIDDQYKACSSLWNIMGCSDDNETEEEMLKRARRLLADLAWRKTNI